MSDTLANALRGGSILDRIANPVTVNPLAAYTGALQTAGGVWANREAQARQAAGQAFLNSINPDGTPNQAALMTGLKSDPTTALAAQEAATRGQTLDTNTFDLQTKRLTQLYGAGVALTAQYPNGVPQDVARAEVDRVGPMAGLSPAQIAQVKSQFGPDPVANSRVILRNSASMLQAHDALLASRPSTEYRNIGGQDVPVTTAPATSPEAGQKTIGGGETLTRTPSAEDMNAVSTIVDANGNATTDTKAGHIKAGRLTPTGALAPGFTETQASPAMVTALRGQEGTPDGRTSVAGARGQMQVTPGFFKQYAQPGESFDSKRDVEAVAQRGIAALEAKYPNDPARVAVAYFSGEGNVAPPGSPTPYKQDLKDANGTSTSAYVSGVMSRFKGAQTATPQPPATGPQSGGTTVPAGSLEQNKIDQEQYNQRTVAYNNSEANLIANLKEAYSLGQKIATGKGLQNLSEARSALVSLGRALDIDMGPMDTADQVRAELDKVLNQVLVSTPGAGRSDASLSTTAGATPHLGMNTNAMLRQLRIMYGQIKQQNAAMLAQDPKTRGIGFQQNHRDMMSNTAREGFAADLMTPEEIDARIKRLGKDTQAGKAFMRAVNQNVAIYGHAPSSGLED